jgi:glycosyltransferase involved in cell wall biosynthesis
MIRHPSRSAADMPTSTEHCLQTSLVIPSHNRASLIGETVESALAQTHPFASITVVNDGSTDDTLKVLAEFGHRIQVISTQNQGVQAARNIGIAASNCPLVAFLDSDDLLAPTYLDETAGWMVAHPEVDATYNNFLTIEDGHTRPPKLTQASFDWLEGSRRDGDFHLDIPDLLLRSLRFQPLFPSGQMVRRTFLQQHGGYDPRFRGVGSEDWEFTLRVITNGQLALCEKPLVKVRKHAANESKDNVRMRMGETEVLAHCLAHHPSASAFKQEITQSIEERLHAALNSAFDNRDFHSVRHIVAKISSPLPAKTRLKTFISSSPAPVSDWLWHAIQLLSRSGA